jgi:hypothetical protein
MSTSEQPSRLKSIVMCLFVALLCLPLIQENLPFVRELPLVGVDPAPPLPAFTKTAWMDGSFQKEYEKAFEQNIGFHNTFVRAHNQFNYSLFDCADFGDVIVGKSGFLYMGSYVKAMTGEDFKGEAYIRLQCNKLKALQDALKKKNIDLFVAVAPGKGSFYPEYLPSYYHQRIKHDSTNYDCYRRVFKEKKINFLDLRDYFQEIKPKSKYDLFPATGVHWTDYGAYIAGEEMLRYIHSLGREVPQPTLDSVTLVPGTGRYNNNYDAAAFMNLAALIPQKASPVAHYRMNAPTQSQKLKFTCIGDSYFSVIVKTGIPEKAFREYHYWLYNDRIFPESMLRDKRNDNRSFRSSVEKQDVICILCTDGTLGVFPFGFVDQAYEIYAERNADYYKIKRTECELFLRATFENISKNREWRASMQRSAKEKGIPDTEEFMNNATWLYHEQQNKLNAQ